MTKIQNENGDHKQEPQDNILQGLYLLNDGLQQILGASSPNDEVKIHNQDFEQKFSTGFVTGMAVTTFVSVAIFILFKYAFDSDLSKALMHAAGSVIAVSVVLFFAWMFRDRIINKIVRFTIRNYLYRPIESMKDSHSVVGGLYNLVMYQLQVRSRSAFRVWLTSALSVMLSASVGIVSIVLISNQNRIVESQNIEQLKSQYITQLTETRVCTEDDFRVYKGILRGRVYAEEHIAMVDNLKQCPKFSIRVREEALNRLFKLDPRLSLDSLRLDFLDLSSVYMERTQLDGVSLVGAELNTDWLYLQNSDLTLAQVKGRSSKKAAVMLSESKLVATQFIDGCRADEASFRSVEFSSSSSVYDTTMRDVMFVDSKIAGSWQALEVDSMTIKDSHIENLSLRKINLKSIPYEYDSDDMRLKSAVDYYLEHIDDSTSISIRFVSSEVDAINIERSYLVGISFRDTKINRSLLVSYSDLSGANFDEGINFKLEAFNSVLSDVRWCSAPRRSSHV